MTFLFRSLNKSEVECRVATCSDKGVSLLLYKDARCDMNILDEIIGSENWQRKHSVVNGNLFCTVSIWDKDKQQWISKEDVGTESFTEKEKGQASDAFKRACFCWGIGRELYTAPFIWIQASDVRLEQKNGKWTTKDAFDVTKMSVENGRIVELEIVNNKTKKQVYKYCHKDASEPAHQKHDPENEQQKHPSESHVKRMWAIAGKAGFDEAKIHEFIKKAFKKESVNELTLKELNAMCDRLEKANG